MDFGLSFNILDDIIKEDELIDSKDFHEFCYNINKLEKLWTNDLFLEEVTNAQKTTKQKVGKVTDATKSTTKAAGELYDQVTDIGGAVYSTQFNLVTMALNAILKVTGWFINGILKVPNAIIKSSKAVSTLTDGVKARIRGDIQLYLTVNDLDTLYNNSLLVHINNIIRDMEALSRGETWSTFFHQRKFKVTDKDGNTQKVKQNDMKLANNMKKEYDTIRNLEFNKTTVDLNNSDNVDLYFSNESKIKINDLTGQTHEYTYYKALSVLVDELTKQSQKLENFKNVIGDKYNKAQLNQSYASMTPGQQKLINETMQMTSKTIVVVGNIIKCIIIDMNTIYNAVDKVASAGNMSVDSVEDIEAEKTFMQQKYSQPSDDKKKKKNNTDNEDKEKLKRQRAQEYQDYKKRKQEG